MKYYYSYNTEDKIFSGKYPAIKNPRRQSEYLLPAMATFREPPLINKDEVAIWDGNDWVVEPDYRGEKQVEVKTKLISAIEYIGKIKDGFQRISDEMAEDIGLNPEKYKEIAGVLSDISNTEEYKKTIEQNQLKIRKTEIERSLYDLDIKRIRAMCEPSVKDEATGETWLEYYNNQVIELRNELNQIETEIS
ncbi:MAG TPA: hypothetical protein H9673_06830 [Candidatus Adamsella sp.]|nr:hypothetical protein [Candidatus Adamsella sp.]